jgi:hypothetical protein
LHTTITQFCAFCQTCCTSSHLKTLTRSDYRSRSIVLAQRSTRTKRSTDSPNRAPDFFPRHKNTSNGFHFRCNYPEMANQGKTFVVEHLDPELEEWSSLEYLTIATESHESGAQFLLSSVPTSLKLPANLQGAKGLQVETRGIEEIYADRKEKVCLLDPAASKDLSPADGDDFDIFLFGGILGKRCDAETKTKTHTMKLTVE